MADETRETRETIVVDRDNATDNGHRSSGLVIAIIIVLLVVLFLWFVGNPFSSGSDSGGADINVDTAPSQSQ